MIPAAGPVGVTVTGLSKAYRGRDGTSTVVLDRFNLELASGSFLSLFGPNASGKTTLLHLIAGVLRPDAGQVAFTNPPMRTGAVGMVFQQYEKSLMPWLTCLDNIAFPLAAIDGLKRAARRARAEAVIADLGLDLPLRSYPYQMSGGQKQLTCLARAMALNPSLLLLDEPFASLDYLHRLEMQEVLQKIWTNTQVTTVLVSHDIDEAIYLADRLLLLGHRPARVLESFAVPLPRPRTVEVLTSPEFVELRAKVLTRFDVEVRR